MRTWGVPVAVAAISAAGLIGALLGDGVVDAFATAAAAAPLAAATWAFLVRRR